MKKNKSLGGFDPNKFGAAKLGNDELSKTMGGAGKTFWQCWKQYTGSSTATYDDVANVTDNTAKAL